MDTIDTSPQPAEKRDCSLPVEEEPVEKKREFCDGEECVVERLSPISYLQSFFRRAELSVWTFIAAAIILLLLFFLGLSTGKRKKKKKTKKKKVKRVKKTVKTKKTRAFFWHRKKRKKVKKKKSKKRKKAKKKRVKKKKPWWRSKKVKHKKKAKKSKKKKSKKAKKKKRRWWKKKRKPSKKKSHKKVCVIKVRAKTRKKHLPVKTFLFVLLLLLFLAATVYAALYVPTERFSPSRWINYGEIAWEATKTFVETGMGLGVLSVLAFGLSFLGGYSITRLLTKKKSNSSSKRSR
jgi:hypothetical protein